MHSGSARAAPVRIPLVCGFQCSCSGSGLQWCSTMASQHEWAALPTQLPSLSVRDASGLFLISLFPFDVFPESQLPAQHSNATATVLGA